MIGRIDFLLLHFFRHDHSNAHEFSIRKKPIILNSEIEQLSAQEFHDVSTVLLSLSSKRVGNSFFMIIYL